EPSCSWMISEVTSSPSDHCPSCQVAEKRKSVRVYSKPSLLQSIAFFSKVCSGGVTACVGEGGRLYPALPFWVRQVDAFRIARATPCHYHAAVSCIRKQAPMSASPLPLFDIGVNLSHESYDHDREAVIDRAFQAGLTGMLLTGTSISCSEKAATIAATLPQALFSTAGVHPHEATHWGIDSSARLHAISQQPQVVAIGETGLDFNRDFSPRPLQERAFAEQLELAVATGLPVFLHQRDAHERFLPILRE